MCDRVSSSGETTCSEQGILPAVSQSDALRIVCTFFSQGTNVYFVGMMGTGKSTVARALAKIMGRYIFLDTDSIIEELLGATVGEVFDKDGEEAFRSVESQVLDQVRLNTAWYRVRK